MSGSPASSRTTAAAPEGSVPCPGRVCKARSSVPAIRGPAWESGSAWAAGAARERLSRRPVGDIGNHWGIDTPEDSHGERSHRPRACRGEPRGLRGGLRHDRGQSLSCRASARCAPSARRCRKTSSRQGEPPHHPHEEAQGPRAVGPSLAIRLFPEDGYGFLRALDGQERYFHRNSVLHGDFGRLAVGTEVRFEPAEGEAGPQASSVQIVNKPGARETAE